MNIKKSKLLYFFIIITITLLISLSSINAAESSMDDSAITNSSIADEQVLKDNTGTDKKVEIEKVKKEYEIKQLKKYEGTTPEESIDYKEPEINMTLNIAKQRINTTIPANTTLNATKQEKNTTLNYTFTDINQNPIKGINKVAIKIDQKTYKKLNITNGVLNTTIDTGILRSGTHMITIIIGENSDYQKLETNITLNIAKQRINTTIPVNTTLNATKQEKNTTLNYTFTDINGNTITGINKAAIKIDQKTYKKLNITNGVLNTTININILKAGTHNITIIIGENSNYQKLERNITLNVAKQRINTTIPANTTLDATINAIKQGKNVTLNYIFTDINGNPITGTNKAVIKMDGQTYKKLNITNGVLNTTIDTLRLGAEKHNMTLIIGENSNYEKLEVNMTIIVEKITIKTITDTINATYPGNVTLNYTFTDVDGDPIKGTNRVAIIINRRTQKAVNMTDGVLNITFDTSKLKVGTYDMKIVIVGENTNYRFCENNMTLILV